MRQWVWGGQQELSTVPIFLCYDGPSDREVMSRRPEVAVAPPLLPPEKAEEIRALLERVLSSHQFRGSRRCQALLRHITERTLTGDTGCLKERTLGIEVFGRSPDYDTSQDPVVRATAAETRKKLAQYYQEPGHECEARIELLPGSYIVELHFNGVAAPAAKQPRSRYPLVVACVSAAALLVLAIVLIWPHWSRSSLDQFWAPVLKSPGPVLISMGQPITYVLRSVQAQDAIQGIGTPQPPDDSAAPDFIPKKDLLILPDRYIMLGDADCLVHLTSLFERSRKPYRIRGERSTSFADLRENSSVLIGAFDNQWTLRAASRLRFTFLKDDAHETDMVRDAQHPENTAWRLTGAWPFWDVPVDYAIVSRILDTTSDRLVVMAAGITQYGTMAAGEFLSNPEYFAGAESRLPDGWQKKNLQIVLRVPVVHRVPGRPQILATHVW
jgi:hypothetical protein